MKGFNIIWVVIIIAVVGLIVMSLVGGGDGNVNRHGVTAPVETVADDSMNNHDDTMSDDEGMGSFEEYSPEKIAMAAEGDVVLFFHAPWCPSCRALEDDISSNLSDIPSNLTILKVDYDSETELKEKYGVRFQHTLVQVDETGKAISGWSGGNRLSDILGRVQ